MYMILEDKRSRSFISCTMAKLVANLSGNSKTMTVFDNTTGEIMFKKVNNKVVWKSNTYGKHTR